MTWSRNLQSAIVLKDDRRLVTLHDAGEFILSLPKRNQQKAHWEQALDALMAAGQPRATENDFAAVQRQLKIALKAEGLV
jgi:hypothetical protein